MKEFSHINIGEKISFIIGCKKSFNSALQALGCTTIIFELQVQYGTSEATFELTITSRFRKSTL